MMMMMMMMMIIIIIIIVIITKLRLIHTKLAVVVWFFRKNSYHFRKLVCTLKCRVFSVRVTDCSYLLKDTVSVEDYTASDLWYY